MNLTGILSVRMKDAGGPVSDSVDTKGTPSIDGRREILLLIHGYNNSFSDASGSFNTFVEKLTDASTNSPFPLPVFGFFWPGDEKNKLASTLSYPFQIARAEESAQRLFDYLSRRSGPSGSPITVHIVAHSLGCRLTLELYRLLENSPLGRSLVFPNVAFMAAAVPVSRVSANGELASAARFSQGTLVLFSKGDRVLEFAFPPGETAAGEGFFPEAVGRFGRPPTWNQSREMVNSHHKPYDHGEYWLSAESAAAVDQLLRVPSSVPVLHNAIGGRALPDANRIAPRLLPSRSIA